MCPRFIVRHAQCVHSLLFNTPTVSTVFLFKIVSRPKLFQTDNSNICFLYQHYQSLIPLFRQVEDSYSGNVTFDSNIYVNYIDIYSFGNNG